MVMKTEGVSRYLKENIGDLGQIELAFIYGSFATKQAGPDSDLDLILVGDVDENQMIQKLAAVERQLSREINYVLLNKEEYQNRPKNKDPFLIQVINGAKIVIIGEIDVG